MGSHVEALEAKITTVQDEICQLKGQIGRVTHNLQAVLSEEKPDEKAADSLQVKREQHARAKERAELRLELLGKERPACERLDAQDRLNSILGEAQAIAKAAAEAKQRYESLLSQLTAAIDPAYSPSLHAKELQREAEYLAEAFNLPMPALPAVSQPEPGAVKVAYVRCAGFYELLFQVYQGPWAQKLSELQASRKRERARQEREQARPGEVRISL